MVATCMKNLRDTSRPKNIIDANLNCMGWAKIESYITKVCRVCDHLFDEFEQF